MLAVSYGSVGRLTVHDLAVSLATGPLSGEPDAFCGKKGSRVNIGRALAGAYMDGPIGVGNQVAGTDTLPGLHQNALEEAQGDFNSGDINHHKEPATDLPGEGHHPIAYRQYGFADAGSQVHSSVSGTVGTRRGTPIIHNAAGDGRNELQPLLGAHAKGRKSEGIQRCGIRSVRQNRKSTGENEGHPADSDDETSDRRDLDRPGRMVSSSEVLVVGWLGPTRQRIASCVRETEKRKNWHDPPAGNSEC
jgi:hypothetical protein